MSKIMTGDDGMPGLVVVGFFSAEKRKGWKSAQSKSVTCVGTTTSFASGDATLSSAPGAMFR